MKKTVGTFLARIFSWKNFGPSAFTLLFTLATIVPQSAQAARRASVSSLCSIRLSEALNDPKVASDKHSQILHEYADAQTRMSAELQVAWADFSNNGLKTDEHLYWLREDGIRDVNTLAGMALTERYLLLKAWHLTRILKENPTWGHLIHRNFKDSVIVTTLKQADLSRLLDAELRKAMERDIVSFDANAITYFNILMNQTKVGYARTFEGAHLKANGLDINTWHKQSTETRDAIQQVWDRQTSRPEASSTDFLVEIYKRKKLLSGSFDSDAIALILRDLKISRKDIPELSLAVETYFKLIQGADMLPPPDMIDPESLVQVEAWLKSGRMSTAKIRDMISRRPWTQRHAMFFRNAYERNAKHVLSVDIKGFGADSFAVRDSWILNEKAQRQDLRKVYEASTERLNKFFEKLSDEIYQLVGIRPVADFRSGDDALFAFGPTITPSELKKVINYLSSQRTDIYFSMASKKAPTDSLSTLIERARVGVNQFKDSQREAERLRSP